MRDPFQYLGEWGCPTCGETAPVTEADWLDPTHVLVSVESPCTHSQGGFFVVDLDDPPWRSRCKAATRAGTRCKRAAGADGLCSLHAGKVTR